MNYFKTSQLNLSNRKRSSSCSLVPLVQVAVFHLFEADGTHQLTRHDHCRKAEASRLVDRYQANQSGSPAEQEVYQLLLENNTLTSRQLSNLIMEEYERFNQTSIQIAELKSRFGRQKLMTKDFCHLYGQSNKIRRSIKLQSSKKKSRSSLLPMPRPLSLWQ